MHGLERRVDVVKCLAHSFNARIRLIKDLRQAVQSRLHGIRVSGFLYLRPILDVQIGIADLGDPVHTDAETDDDLGTVHIIGDRSPIIDTGCFQLLSCIAYRIHIGQVVADHIQPFLVGLYSGKRRGKPGESCSYHIVYPPKIKFM